MDSGKLNRAFFKNYFLRLYRLTDNEIKTKKRKRRKRRHSKPCLLKLVYQVLVTADNDVIANRADNIKSNCFHWL